MFEVGKLNVFHLAGSVVIFSLLTGIAGPFLAAAISVLPLVIISYQEDLISFYLMLVIVRSFSVKFYKENGRPPTVQEVDTIFNDREAFYSLFREDSFLREQMKYFGNLTEEEIIQAEQELKAIVKENKKNG